MRIVKKYWVELSLIFGYLIADNLHMIVRHYNYTPLWYTPFVKGYYFYDSVFFTLHYFAQAPLLMTFILFVSSPRDLNKIWLRLSLLICSFRDFLGELFEALNLKITWFSNSGYNASCYAKICFLIAALLLAFPFKKRCMKIMNYFSSG